MTRRIAALGRPMKEAPPKCTSCGKLTLEECSRAECDNRHAVTAQPGGCGSPLTFPSCGMTVPRHNLYGED